MAKLHPQLKTGLGLVPEDQPVHLLTRHSVREMAKNGFADYRLPLTPEGVEMARSWGGELGRPVQHCFSSPVGRCVDTATAMLEGLEAAGLQAAPVEIEHVQTLVEPGCYVEDIARVGPRFLELGAIGFLNHHLNGELDGLLTPALGHQKLVRYLRERDPAPGHLALHVTHDTILMAFIAEMLGLRQVSDADWPWMMEGVWLWFDDDGLHWIWRGEKRLRPHTD